MSVIFSTRRTTTATNERTRPHHRHGRHQTARHGAHGAAPGLDPTPPFPARCAPSLPRPNDPPSSSSVAAVASSSLGRRQAGREGAEAPFVGDRHGARRAGKARHASRQRAHLADATDAVLRRRVIERTAAVRAQHPAWRRTRPGSQRPAPPPPDSPALRASTKDSCSARLDSPRPPRGRCAGECR